MHILKAIGQEVKIDTTNAEPVYVQAYGNKVKTLPIVSLTNDAVLAYENNPAFKPKLDFTPTGNIAPPSNLNYIFYTAPTNS